MAPGGRCLRQGTIRGTGEFDVGPIRNDEGGDLVANKDDLMVAKINAALKIIEWSKDDIEPGIDGSPEQLHMALAEAFRLVYGIVSESVGPSESTGTDKSTEEFEIPVA